MYFTEGYVTQYQLQGWTTSRSTHVSKKDRRDREGSERTQVRNALQRAKQDPEFRIDDPRIQEVSLAREKTRVYRPHFGQMGLR